MNKIKVGIVGGAGYTGGELLRILIFHPQCEIIFVHSNSNAGNFIYDAHSDLFGLSGMKFTNKLQQDIDVLFLCLGHGDSKVFLQENSIDSSIKIIDLSQDFRLDSPDSKNFVYGLPEVYRENIKSAQYIANPGCFATCIQLALLPVAAQNILNDDVQISAITGSTGAGQKPAKTTHFSWRNNNISVYKAFEHQHLKEINQTVKKLQPGFSHKINFLPFRGNFSRGILTAAYFKTELSAEKAQQIYTDYYKDHPFVHLSKNNPDVKQVVNTNNCVLYLEKHDDKLLVISIIDNLLKGASGQAVQNMNLLFGLDETTGLRLKAVSF